MKVLLASGYSELDGTSLWVRDSAFDSAAPDDMLILWNTEQGYELGDGEEFMFPRKTLVVQEYDKDYSSPDDIEDTLTEVPSVNTNIPLSEAPIVNGDLEDNEMVTDIKPGDRVLVTLRCIVIDADATGIYVQFQETEDSIANIDLIYTNEDVRDIKVLPPALTHPAVGSLVRLTLTDRHNAKNGHYILGADDHYHGISSECHGYMVEKHSPLIQEVIVNITK